MGLLCPFLRENLTTMFICLRFLISLSLSIGLIVSMSGEHARAQNAAYTLIVSPTTVAPGGLITLSWQAPDTHAAKDRIGLFLAGLPSGGNTMLAMKYVPSGTSGTLTFIAPNTGIELTYQLRYLLDNGFSEAARSSVITVARTTSSTAPGPSPGSRSATLFWTLGSESDLAGYKIHIGLSSGVYNYPGSPFSVGRTNTHMIANLPVGQTYFFALSAYDKAGNNSPLSAEISKSVY